MVISIKREILAQLRRIGFHFEPLMLRILPPSTVTELTNEEGIGRTFYIDLPNNADSVFPAAVRINETLLKNLKGNTNLIENARTHFTASQANPNQILLQVNFETLVKELFGDLKQNLHRLFAHHRKLDADNGGESYFQTVIVEYSSPNIAKPFHVGNLRSTIIGNSIANILQFKGHNVIRMNYLGDWGTQFGILSLAYDHFGDEQKLIAEPLKHLFDVYVKGNQEMETNPEWSSAVKQRFFQLESKSNLNVFNQWIRFRELSLHELKLLYERLGIHFDIFSSESMYSDSSYEMIKMLTEKGLIEKIDNALYANLTSHEDSNKNVKVPLLKSDGSTLYLTRDIAALMHRKKLYNFDRIFYVVDSSQSKHFNNLKSVFCSLDDPVHREIKHLKFGRIVGMSTRRGETIFLDDVLNEAKTRALESIASSPNTKIDQEDYDRTADVLGVSSLIIHDLANRRVKEYRFNWNKALRLTGDTGISLQYTHARLCNLMRNCGCVLNPNCDINVGAINSKNSRILINLLAMFDEMIDRSYEELEPSVITNYLFELKSAINRANQELTIKGQEASIAQTRLMLFICAHNVLNQCMKLLGLQPLESM